MGGLSFLLGLFGCGYYGTKVAVEQKAEKEFVKDLKQGQENTQNRLDAFRKLVADNGLEDKMRIAACYKDCEGYEKYLEELNQTWSIYFRPGFTPYTLSVNNITRMLLANRGKLRNSDVSCGISLAAEHFHDPRKTTAENMKDYAYFVSAINRQLKAHGVDIPMCAHNQGLDPRNKKIMLWHGTMAPSSEYTTVAWMPAVPEYMRDWNRSINWI